MTVNYEVPLSSGGGVLIEADRTTSRGSAGTTLASPTVGEAVGKVKRNLRDLVADLAPVIADVKAGLTDLEPGDVELEFGLKFSAEAGFVIAKGTTEVNLTVKVGWHGPRQ